MAKTNKTASGKVWWKSKTFWVNVISISSMIAASEFGVEIDPATSVTLLSMINIVLRMITKEPIVWTSSNKDTLR